MNQSTRKTTKRNSGPQQTRRARRDHRYAVREELYTVSKLERVRDCGRPMSHEVAVRVSDNGTERIAGFNGLATCGSVWACPVCSAKIANKRQAEIEHVVNRHTSIGRDVAMLTLTMRHNKGQSLKELWHALSAAWKAATNGSGWKRDKQNHGVAHTIRVVEVTHGQNGWHVHVHALLLGLDFSDKLKLHELGYRMFGRWSRKLQKLGMQAPIAHKGGLKIQSISPDKSVAEVLADYFTKAGMDPDVQVSEETAEARREAKSARDMARKISMEATRSDLKTAKRNNRTPWQILSDFLVTGDVADLDLWHEYEEVSRGKRQISGMSKQLREEYGLDEEQTDEEIAEEEHGGETVAMIESAHYREGCRRDSHFPARILDAAEDDGKAGIDKVLQRYGLPPSEAPSDPQTFAVTSESFR